MGRQCGRCCWWCCWCPQNCWSCYFSSVLLLLFCYLWQPTVNVCWSRFEAAELWIDHRTRTCKVKDKRYQKKIQKLAAWDHGMIVYWHRFLESFCLGSILQPVGVTTAEIWWLTHWVSQAAHPTLTNALDSKDSSKSRYRQANINPMGCIHNRSPLICLSIYWLFVKFLIDQLLGANRGQCATPALNPPSNSFPSICRHVCDATCYSRFVLRATTNNSSNTFTLRAFTYKPAPGPPSSIGS